jgi:hypothetical protein
MAYKKIQHVAGAAVMVSTAGVHPPATVGPHVTPISNELVNQMLTRGWVIVKIATHTSRVHDATAIVYVLGLPKEAPDEPDEKSED